MSSKIGPFIKYEQKPNDIKFGSIYTLEVKIPVPYYQDRIVRVYLPDDYDDKEEFPVIYMSDGQNMVDKYTSAYGAWEIDRRQHELCKKGYPSYILVGIDCPHGPKERVLEYSFPYLHVLNKYSKMSKKKYELYSHKFFNWIVYELKPLIDACFKVSKSRELTACAGSSMGGVFALSLFSSFPDVFGAAFCFSPAYFLYKRSEVKKYMLEAITRTPKDSKLYFYSGNIGYEHNFIYSAIDMYQLYLKNGFDRSHLMLSLDVNGEHNEVTWSRHYNEAIKFWFDN